METMAQPNQFMGIKGRPVSSLEEARATSIDFDGSVFYFPDLVNHKIYTKQINMDGTCSFNVYQYVEPAIQTYITREEFDAAIEQLKQTFAASNNNVPAGPIAQSGQTDRPQIKF